MLQRLKTTITYITLLLMMLGLGSILMLVLSDSASGAQLHKPSPVPTGIHECPSWGCRTPPWVTLKPTPTKSEKPCPIKTPKPTIKPTHKPKPSPTLSTPVTNSPSPNPSVSVTPTHSVIPTNTVTPTPTVSLSPTVSATATSASASPQVTLTQSRTSPPFNDTHEQLPFTGAAHTDFLIGLGATLIVAGCIFIWIRRRV